jgi:hypothetical protein
MLANFRGLIVGFLVLAAGQAPAAEGGTTLTYVPGSSVKLYQVNGDCDWVEWDATITKKPPTCKPTTSRTATRADVLGNDVPAVFEHGGEMIITFGDTFGADNDRYPKWVSFKKPFQWKSHDPIAHSNTLKASDGLLVDFFMDGDHALVVHPPPQPDGKPVPMGADDVPSTGVSINGQIYLGITTGTVRVGPGSNLVRRPLGRRPGCLDIWRVAGRPRDLFVDDPLRQFLDRNRCERTECNALLCRIWRGSAIMVGK